MSIFDRVMKSTNVSLCAFIVPQAKERCIRSQTRYTNLLTWFDIFKIFLIEFRFAVFGWDGEPVFDEKTMYQIQTLKQWISLLTEVRQWWMVGQKSHSTTLISQCQV
jgi:hypothetical protein